VIIDNKYSVLNIIVFNLVEIFTHYKYNFLMTNPQIDEV